MSRIRLALSLIPLVTVLACGSGGGGSASAVVADFTPEPPAKNNDSVSMTGAENGDEVTVSVNINQTTSVSGADFDVMFDTANVTFVDWDPGTLLEQGGATPIYTVGTTAGGITVAATRTGGSTTNVNGTMPLIKLTFRVDQVGTFDLAIDNEALYGSGVPPASKGGIEWTAGSLVGN
jgi:hypothetical protein